MILAWCTILILKVCAQFADRAYVDASGGKVIFVFCFKVIWVSSTHTFLNKMKPLIVLSGEDDGRI